MEIRNLSETDVPKIEGLVKELKKTNPAIQQRIFDEVDEPNDVLRRLNELEDKIDTILTKLKFIFGDCYLLEGRFISMTKGHQGG